MMSNIGSSLYLLCLERSFLIFHGHTVMNHSLKAALWSALVLPGLGHVMLKRYIVGGLFALISLSALSVIVVKVFNISHTIVEQINQGSVQADMAGVIEIISQSSVLNDTNTMNIAFIIYLIIWLLSILDAYRIGDSLDKSTTV